MNHIFLAEGTIFFFNKKQLHLFSFFFSGCIDCSQSIINSTVLEYKFWNIIIMLKLNLLNKMLLFLWIDIEKEMQVEGHL